MKIYKNFRTLSAGSKVLVVAGSLVAAFGIFCTFLYASAIFWPCGFNTESSVDQNTTFAVIMPLAQAAAVSLNVYMISRLASPRSYAYKILTGVAISLILGLGLLAMMGWGFAIGTMCSNAGL